MRNLLTLVICSLVTVVTTAGVASPTQAPSAEELLLSARTYLAGYAQRVSGVTLDEALMLTENANALRTAPQRLASDLILLNVGGQLLGMRDLYSVDTRAVRAKETRIAKVLAEPTPATWQTAQDYAREHAVYLRTNVVLWFSDPVMVTRCLAPEYRGRLTFKVEGSKRLNGVQVYGLGFKESDKEPEKSILQIPGYPLASGRFWVEAESGRIHQTEFWPESPAHNARVQVQYAPDEKLGVFLPRSASHTFEARERGTGISGTGGGGNSTRITFESTAQYSAPRYTPIDLSRFAWRAP